MYHEMLESKKHNFFQLLGLMYIELPVTVHPTYAVWLIVNSAHLTVWKQHIEVNIHAFCQHCNVYCVAKTEV